VIANEREYRIARAAAQRFEMALAQVEDRGAERHPLLQKALRESIESELKILRAQLAEYDALRTGQIAVLELESLRELPEALIRARVAAGLTQKELAARLGLKEQQIQRYEATRYSGANLDRLQAVADAIGIQIRERVVLTRAGHRPT
jgi:ribosome-binding protein aMBF1 (putative translation factor)